MDSGCVRATCMSLHDPRTNAPCDLFLPTHLWKGSTIEVSFSPYAHESLSKDVTQSSQPQHAAVDDDQLSISR